MRNFLFVFSKFIVITTFIFTIFVIVTGLLVKQNFNYNLIDKKILILGDSHTLCGVDDAIIPNSINLSESADTYFYSYLKLREFCDRNKNVKKVVLGFAEHNVSESQDTWLKSESINNKKLIFYYFLFDIKDLLHFSQINPLDLIRNSARIIKGNIGHLYRIYEGAAVNEFGIGTHLKLYEKVDSTVEIKPNKNIVMDDRKYSEYDIIYLKEIYKYCEDNKIELILLNSPVLQKNNAYTAQYLKIYHEFLKNAQLLDLSYLTKNKKYFSDLDHLNNEGAIFFSNFLKDKL
ncbi:hypothetical protein EGI11_07470 [Chryseobacterium sp. H3056]|uniref:SGNH/GDSL hydrolase family protein n=1 Tax=Kaistella daneshvariae TaxID=2487074 RepID=A0A3N0WW01_9FLAO|nr:hypothetical protein [Kaistella daneshvariae]ROI09242.1 hypothetical protein EGI11_07470 [Kaistella daneshvariae]